MTFIIAEEKGSVYAALLESTGTAVITHCVSQWLVTHNIPAETVAKISTDPSGIQDSGESLNSILKGVMASFLMLQPFFPPFFTPQLSAAACVEVVTRLSPLLHLFSSALSTTSLLLHCTWHQAHLWNLAVNPQKVCVLLWCVNV